MAVMHVILASLAIVFTLLFVAFLINNHIINSTRSKENGKDEILREFFKEKIEAVEEKAEDQETDYQNNGR